MLELKNIYKYYNPGTVNEMCLFKDFNLTVKDGEFLSVVGSNGSGKTSMLNIICGSIPIESKNIYKYYNPGTDNEMCLFKDFKLTVKDGEFLSVV